MRVGIPDYRLPKDVLDREIRWIKSVGVEIKVNTEVESVDKLLADGYDAVFTAIGAHEAVKMGIEGEDIPGIIEDVSLLKDVNQGKKVELGDRILVVGGGNSAVDAARVSLRLGAKEVFIVYRRSREEMPANPAEVEEAMKEGVQIEFLAAPTKVKRDNGRLKVDCIRMKLGEVDASGRRMPEPIPSSEFSMDADAVVSAIGQVPKVPTQFGVAITNEKTIKVDNKTLVSSKKGVFAGGDVVTGPASVIEAIAAGRQAAANIDKYLGGKGIVDEVLASPEVEVMPQIPSSLSKGAETLPSLPIAERLAGFVQVEPSLSEEAAMEEAQACLWCDLELVVDGSKCSQCRTCQLICSLAYEKTFNPLKARIVISDVSGTEEGEPSFTDECIYCNLCARYCAHGALSLRKGGI